MKVALIVAFACISAVSANAETVQDADTAIKIAKAALIKEYGDKEAVENDGPYQAVLHESVWSVYGRFHPSKPPYGPVGPMVVKIEKQTGKVIGIYPGK
jgi:hypothetical protein